MPCQFCYVGMFFFEDLKKIWMILLSWQNINDLTRWRHEVTQEEMNGLFLT